jgi:glutamine amidotransferase
VIRIVSSGVGNVRAYLNLFKSLGIAAGEATRAEELSDATRIILPGVGSFDWAMSRLDASGIRSTLDEMVLGRKVPVLAVCVGMQILGQRSEEGSAAGLGWLSTEVRKFKAPEGKTALPLPHMGWNDVSVRTDSKLFSGLEGDARFYFLHSYYVLPAVESLTLASTEYMYPFACAVGRDNIFGVQFHPEKSHGWGQRLLQNFARL